MPYKLDAMMRKMIGVLSGCGMQRIVVAVLHENLAMRELARSNGFGIDAAGSDADALRGMLTLPRST